MGRDPFLIAYAHTRTENDGASSPLRSLDQRENAPTVTFPMSAILSVCAVVTTFQLLRQLDFSTRWNA